MRHPSAAPLTRLARAAGVAVQYEASGVTITPPDDTVRDVLDALGHPCADEQAAAASLRALRLRPWTRPVDPVAVQWTGDPEPATVTISAPPTTAPELALTLEDGSVRELPAPRWGGYAALNDGARRRGSVALPADLPLGYHELTVATAEEVGRCTVIVAPQACPQPGPDPGWGWMVQTYALRSRPSWGQGEFRDLGELASWSAGHGASFVLSNPVHAPAPTLPQQPSPYSPASRRFYNPSYLHIPDVPGFVGLPASERAALLDLPPALRPEAPRIDRDEIWTTKRAALQTLFDRLDGAGRARLAAYRRDRGTALERFATFCALAEVHHVPFWEWPPGLRDPRNPDVGRWTQAHADHVDLHSWLQLLCEDQLTAAQDHARAAGMAIGVIHDLAVGVDAAGADVWSLPDEITRRMSVGAPPDAFNQQGQNWGQAPLLPDPLRANGYRTLRELLRAALRAGGGVRIDHILGLSRLYWIPRDRPATEGTYVQYPADEQFAVLALEAHRADAIVVGEDLGTVDDRIRHLMHRRGVAKSAVLFFEHTREGDRLPAAQYPRTALASVTTHDLPTAVGFWEGSALEVRAELGLLTGTREAERRRLAHEQESLLRLLIAHGCLDDARAGSWDRTVAMHRFLAGTPTLLVAATLWDAIGDPRQPNMPGTTDEYPNWRLPLVQPGAGGSRPFLLEDLDRSARIRDTIAALQR